MHKAVFAAITTVGAFAVAPSTASDGPLDHTNPPQLLTVEHAEILAPGRDGVTAEGYLTIWNGTNQQVSLESIRSDAFGRISILRTELGAGPSKVLPVEGVLPVPGHAELTMRVNGIRLLLEEPLSQGDELTGSSRLTLVFDGGQKLEVTADIVRSGDRITIHHHGQGDVGVN